jgi:threonyl-tRNA synthetase
MRVRGFTQDDAHIFCTEEQIKDEVAKFIVMLFKAYQDFGFKDVLVKLSTRPEKRVGSDETWDKAESALQAALVENKLEFDLQPGEGAFYGPKIEFNIKDSIGRLWQCGTIQLDFSMPERFELEYTGSDGKKHRPVMIHRAIYGSLERFIGILTENFEGKFPFWISPSQIRVLSVSEAQNVHSKSISDWLISYGYRVEVDLRNEKIGYKIRDSILKKANFLLIIGDKEIEGNTISFRKRGEENTTTVSREEFLKLLSKEKDS